MNLNKCQILDKTLELELLKEYKITKSKRISDRLFEGYYPLVKQIAYSVYRRSSKSRVDLKDLISDGSIGLMIAIDKFDPEKAQQLYPVAYLWIREYVHRGVMKNLSMMRDLSTNSKTRLLYHKFRRTMIQMGFVSPMNSNQHALMAEKLKVPVIDIEFFETIMHEHGDIDSIAPHLSNNETEADANVAVDAAKLKRFIDTQIMPNLSYKEQMIIKRRILSDDRVEEIASEFNQSKAAVYQAEKRLRELIKNKFTAQMT